MLASSSSPIASYVLVTLYWYDSTHHMLISLLDNRTNTLKLIATVRQQKVKLRKNNYSRIYISTLKFGQLPYPLSLFYQEPLVNSLAVDSI